VSGLFDVSKEIILVTGASAGNLPASSASRDTTGSVVTVDGLLAE
jgi:hypothetical protein